MTKQKPSAWQFPNKIVVAPCGGIGQTAGTISRQAAYEVVEKLMPEETVLLCLPAFNIDVEEDVEMVRQNPSRVVVIEGCANLCMTKLLELKGFKPAKMVCIPRIVSKMGITVEKSKNRARLSALEKKVVSVVAAKTVAEAKSLKV
jgi:uncharacterized metal-binding protein